MTCAHRTWIHCPCFTFSSFGRHGRSSYVPGCGVGGLFGVLVVCVCLGFVAWWFGLATWIVTRAKKTRALSTVELSSPERETSVPFWNQISFIFRLSFFRQCQLQADLPLGALALGRAACLQLEGQVEPEPWLHLPL